jgi:hypothetical protein
MCEAGEGLETGAANDGDRDGFCDDNVNGQTS